MTYETVKAQRGYPGIASRVLASADWLINNIVFPIRLRRWYYFNVSSKSWSSARLPLEYSLRTHFIGAVIIRHHPVRALVPRRIRERWKNEVAAALARR